MGSRFKDRGLGAIKADERGGAEAGAAGGVGCFDVGNCCEIAGCRSAGSHGIISSEATSGGEVSLMEVLLTTCKTCDPSPSRLPPRTYLRDSQWLPKESNKTPP